MVDIELVSRKLSRLQGYVDELEAAKDINWNSDEELVYGFFNKHLADFKLFSTLIRQWVKQRTATPS